MPERFQQTEGVGPCGAVYSLSHGIERGTLSAHELLLGL